jgi:hypothetical protein
MKTELSFTNAQTEAQRKRQRDELNAQLSSMSLSEAIAFLKKSFKCSAEKGGQVLKKDYLSGTKTFLGKLKITNQCQFQLASTVDIKHILGYCCNDHYESCPVYQVYACSNALMSSIRR